MWRPTTADTAIRAGQRGSGGRSSTRASGPRTVEAPAFFNSPPPSCGRCTEACRPPQLATGVPNQCWIRPEPKCCFSETSASQGRVTGPGGPRAAQDVGVHAPDVAMAQLHVARALSLALLWRHPASCGPYLEYISAKQIRPEGRGRLLARCHRSGFIFGSGKQGRHQSSAAVSVAFARLAATLGLKGVSHHVLRHTGATVMVAHGVSLRAVQTIGGWSSTRVSTTQSSHGPCV
jgi:hypothetical protein